MSNRVQVTLEGGVADVRMVRADKLNALDAAMIRSLAETGQALARDPSLRAVVLSGEGRAFCAGLDFQSFMAMAGTGGPTSSSDSAAGPAGTATGASGLLSRQPGSPANLAQLACHAWTTLPVPVIAAVWGVAFGGGLQIALAADLRIVAPDAKLSVMEIKWGLIPDMTGTQTLRHLVRLDVAKELTFTGRVVSGSEAVALGLATRVHDRPLEHAREIAREIAGKSPDAIRAGKRLLQAAWLASPADGLRMEEREQLGLIGGANQLEAIRANMEKREPQFQDPKVA